MWPLSEALSVPITVLVLGTDKSPGDCLPSACMMLGMPGHRDSMSRAPEGRPGRQVALCGLGCEEKTEENAGESRFPRALKGFATVLGP